MTCTSVPRKKDPDCAESAPAPVVAPVAPLSVNFDPPLSSLQVFTSGEQDRQVFRVWGRKGPGVEASLE